LPQAVPAKPPVHPQLLQEDALPGFVAHPQRLSAAMMMRLLMIFMIRFRSARIRHAPGRNVAEHIDDFAANGYFFTPLFGRLVFVFFRLHRRTPETLQRQFTAASEIRMCTFLMVSVIAFGSLRSKSRRRLASPLSRLLKNSVFSFSGWDYEKVRK
jgi:hypothetical protein